VVLIVVGVNMSASVTSAAQILTFMLLSLSGMIVIYSLWIVLIALTFWFVKFDNNVTILQALMDAGRYPATVYPAWLRVIVTFIIPIAVATTIPLQALRGELSVIQVLTFLGVSVLSFLIATRVWKTGLKQYSGASS
jgi:ABC-2 type transport system permease protein